MDASSPLLSRRAYWVSSEAYSWEEIWEAGTYYERLAELLEDARHSVVFVGWQVDSRLPLRRPMRPGIQKGGRETLKNKMLRLCREKPEFQAYFLMWDHAYFYSIERETLQGRVWDNIHPRIHFVFDNRHPFGASHHEKLVIIDGKVAFCGGIDICDERWDTPHHLYVDPRRSLHWQEEAHGPYHDAAVQVTGPVCRQMLEHVERRWTTLTSIPFPSSKELAKAEKGRAGGGHRVYISRTIASVDAGERGVPLIREIEFLFLDLIRRARRRILIENQYYWSERINDRLILKMEEMAGQDFEIILILADMAKVDSPTKHMAVHELKLLKKLKEAAKRHRIRLHAVCPLALSPDEPHRQVKPVYIHSKLMIVDDLFFTIGSANIADRALRVDTELNLTLEARTVQERQHIRKISELILKHWNFDRTADEHIQLREFSPAEEIQDLRRKWPWAAEFPFVRFFDPQMPWLYFLKRRYRILEKTRYPLTLLIGLFLTLTVSTASLAVAGFLWMPEDLAHSIQTYIVMLSFIWLIPVPFLFLTLFAVLDHGAASAAVGSVSALWCAATAGYLLTRMFPTSTSRYYRKTSTRRPARLRLRRFPYLLAILLDPRVSMRAKIAYQGLNTIYLPWFALGTLVLLPSVIYGAAQLFEVLVFTLAGSKDALRSAIDRAAPGILAASFLYAIITVIWSLRRNLK